MNSLERIKTLLDGQLPDRPPHFELLRNDAVFSHFAGVELTHKNAEDVVYGVTNQIIDSTRPLVRLPDKPRVETDSDGRRVAFERWTFWADHRKIADLGLFAKELENQIKANQQWGESDDDTVKQYIARHKNIESSLPQVFLFWSSPGPGIGLHHLYNDIGIEQFSYLMVDYPELIGQFMESSTDKAIEYVARISQTVKVPAFFVGEDIAFKGATLFSPAFLEKEFFGRLTRLVSAMHKAGAKVMYHSDGNVMGVLEKLIETGIDVLNPIEIIAGMDISEIHKRAPSLILAGGIDVSELLPSATPEKVAEAVQRAVDDSEGRIMVGSSTELHNEVPLQNYLAMYETIMNIRY